MKSPAGNTRMQSDNASISIKALRSDMKSFMEPESVAPRLQDYAFLDVSETLGRLVSGNKPVVSWLYGENSEGIGERFEKEGKIMTFPTIERAAWALSVLRKRQAYLERVSGR